MIDAKPIAEELVLRRDHVGIGVLGKVRMQSITRLARFSVADSVGQYHVILGRVEQLARPE